MNLQTNQFWENDNGDLIRIDRIHNGQVYYVAWRYGWSVGNPFRRPIDDMKERMGEHHMREVTDGDQ